MKTTALLQTKKYTPEEYLDLEDKAEYKSEYWNGYIIPLHGESPVMVGAGVDHVQIVTNLIEILSPQLKKKDCRTFSNDLKIWIPNREKFFYPDVVIVCGKLEFYEKRRDVVVNPTLIVEVLSDSTASFDRSEKLWLYQTIETLQEYVLISPDKAVIEKYQRRDDGNWIYRATIGLESSIKFESIATEIALSEIYDLVEFETDEIL
jgi:Uma2 family endonuclease